MPVVKKPEGLFRALPAKAGATKGTNQKSSQSTKPKLKYEIFFRL